MHVSFNYVSNLRLDWCDFLRTQHVLGFFEEVAITLKKNGYQVFLVYEDHEIIKSASYK